VLSHGRIVEVGDHDSLLRRDSAYAERVERQLQDGERKPESRRKWRQEHGNRADAE